MKKKLVSLSVLLLLLAGAPVVAQETTGAVDGIVTDASGGALPGVLVEAKGDRLVGGARTITNEKGRYRFPALPSGTYELTASLEGFVTTNVPPFRLGLGEGLSISFSMDIASVEETIQVTSEAPLISVTQSATSTSISDELIESLPRGRDFTSVVTQAAHAADEDAAGGISIDGASGSENRFVVDGVDTTFLISGTSGKTVVTDFVQEVQVKSSGYDAEYGGSTGGVINVTTKTGGNQFHGNVGAYYEDRGWNGDERPILELDPLNPDLPNQPVFDEDDIETIEPGFSLGGPILRDKLWFFAAYSPREIDTNRTVDFRDGTRQTFNRNDERDYGVLNLTGALGDNVSYRLGYNVSDRLRDNWNLPAQSNINNPSDASSDPADYDVDRDQPNESWHVGADWIPTSNFFVSGRGGHFEYDSRDVGFNRDVWLNFIGSPGASFPGQVPAGLDRPSGFSTPRNDGNVFDLLERDQVRVDGTFYLDDFGGSHSLKVGFQLEEIANQVLNGYSNTRNLFYWDRSVTTSSGVSRRGTYGYYRPIIIATDGDVAAESSAFFIQDSWTLPNDRLTFNVGVRWEAEEIPSFATRADIPSVALDFGYSDKVAPRFGFAYDVMGDGDWKVYGSFGTFYDTMKLSLARGAFGGQKWIDNYYALDTLDWQSIANTCRVVDNSITGPPPEGCPGELLFRLDQRSASNDPTDLRIDPNLKPYESEEISLGVQHQLSSQMSIGLRYVHKELVRAIEDVGILDAEAEAQIFFIANPGEGIAGNILGPDFPSLPKPVREYDGIEIDFRKRMSNSWAFHATYLYSKLYGNYAGLASSDEISDVTGIARTAPNVERYFDSLISSYDPQGNLVFGRLSTDRPHQFKAQLIYETPWGTTVGANQFIGSGTPISTEYDGPAGNPFFPFGRGDLGRTPTLTQTDLYLAHPFTLGDRYEIELSVNVLNLFDEDTVRKIYNEATLQALPLTDEQFFQGFDPNQVVADNNIPIDPRFGLASIYQAEREVRVSARFRF